MKLAPVVLLAVASTILAAQQGVPIGTILPVRLDSTLSQRSFPGQSIKATVMQEVPLPNGVKIPERAQVLGEVTAIDLNGPTVGLRLSLKFDHLKTSKANFRILTDLRAMASELEVDAAQMPEVGGDRGTPSTAYTTVQVGGNEVVYRGGGHVMNALEVVGEPVVPHGVLGRARPNLTGGCRGAVNDNDSAQALWLFASDACGVYGFDNLAIVSAGRVDPVGQITLFSKQSNLKIRAGTGMLLRIIAGN
jgi:hypothetical protein